MGNFSVFKNAVDEQFERMKGLPLFVVDVEKNELWDLYLDSFPSGTNPIFRERTEHDCQCCKQFIRNLGKVVALNDINGEIISIWDVELDDSTYSVVAGHLAAHVKTKAIKDVYLHYENHVGTDKNHEQREDGSIHTWKHFYCNLPSSVVHGKDSIPSTIGEHRTDKEVYLRSMETISKESAEIVNELISQGSLYRGEEHATVVNQFLKEKELFEACSTDKDNFAWDRSIALNRGARFRNTVIGTLLVDLSDGVDLTKAVNSFEAKVAPANYKRPKALVTKRMVEDAKKKITELGFADSIHRRHAEINDVKPTDVLFVDRAVRQGLDVFDEIGEETVDLNKLKRVQEVPIDKFINDILPQATSLELLVENRLEPNLMTLTSQLHTDAPSLFKWDNGFSWSYNGEVADSIRDRVVKAGGSVTGALRFSLSWFNTDDLDLHLKGPKGMHVFFSQKRSGGGILDVDMNVHSHNAKRDAVENITFDEKSSIPEGKYSLLVHNYTPRENKDIGFEVEVEYEGSITTYAYGRKVSGYVTVVEFDYSRKDGLKITQSLPSTTASREVWGIGTHRFHKANFVMLSPNHWNGKQVGNKHWFFILDQCRNPDSVRGFYNEYINGDLTPHRKVLEVLGSKMRAEYSDSQLSGLGFSSTQTNYVFCSVKGAFDRIVKITF